jgi:hypothetical protein
LSLVATLAAQAQSPVGAATSVIPATSYTRNTKVATLEINGAVEQNDRVKTSGKGSTQIKFVDGTVITIGPNSEVLLDKTIFDDNRARNVTVELTRGAMRFASGVSDHNAYHIKTGVAVIGVRGTVIDVSYENNKTIYRTVEGEAQVCDVRNFCRDVREGDPPIAVTLQGIVLATAAEAERLFRVLDLVTTALAGQAKNVLDGVATVAEPPLTGVGKVVKGVDDTVHNIGKGVVKGIGKMLGGGKPEEKTPDEK